MSVELRYYTDPGCSWSWGAEPAVRRLVWEFGDEIRFRWVMGGLARSYGPDYADEEGSIGSGADCFADLMAHWLDVAAETGMPCDPRLWTRNPIASTYPACMAVKAAAEQGPQAEGAYLRRVREGLMVERRKLDHAEALVGEAGTAGLDVERFRIDLGSHAITEAFAADLSEVRDVPDEARSLAGKVRRTEGHERLSFPTAVFVAADGSRTRVYGYAPYRELREAALAAGANPQSDGRPTPIDAIERFGRSATHEVEELTGLPGPVARAELWALAREWRIRAVPALTGELWELA